MIIAFLITGTHLLLDYGLIYGHFGLSRLGLNGAAVAAWVGQLVGAATCLAFSSSRSMAAYRNAKWRISLGRCAAISIGSDLAIRTGALRGSLVSQRAAPHAWELVSYQRMRSPFS
jgi:Na+-driven multidrug efflux pump